MGSGAMIWNSPRILLPKESHLLVVTDVELAHHGDEQRKGETGQGGIVQGEEVGFAGAAKLLK